MRILVAGAGGIVGSHIAEHFAKRGDQVIALELERAPPALLPVAAAWAGFDLISKMPPVTSRKVPAFTPGVIREAAGPGLDAAIFALTPPGAEGTAADFVGYFSNATAVLEACASLVHPPAYVHCSSLRVYGGSIAKVPVVEDADRYRFAIVTAVPEIMPIDQAPQTPAGAVVAAADLLAQSYGHFRRLRLAVLRLGAVAGARAPGPSGVNWIGRMAGAAILGTPVELPGNRKIVRDLVDADDVALAVRAFLDAPSTQPLVLNVGGGVDHAVSYGDVLDAFEKRTGKPVPVTFQPPPAHLRRIIVTDIDRIRERLHWKPRIPVAAVLERTAAWFEENRSLFA
ncbi:MAG: NAD-dependent epimerase/dehydratase family protein [Planctomycetota bacterium]